VWNIEEFMNVVRVYILLLVNFLTKWGRDWIAKPLLKFEKVMMQEKKKKRIIEHIDGSWIPY